VTGFSQRGTEIDPRSVHVRFVVNRVALVQVSLPTCFPVSIIPPTLSTRVHQHVAVTRRAKGRILETVQKGNYAALVRNVLSLFSRSVTYMRSAGQ
jgi:hypothetical protein